MQMNDIPFAATDWSQVERVEKSAQAGQAFWQTLQYGELRVRKVEYTPGYVSDHWCTKGHVLLCLAGELHTELQDGRQFILTPGMSYQVADNAEPHRSTAPLGATLFIVD
ncbi:DHCW motif cupin fold protein [Acidovorax sp.]|uniref:DHCW motif cupin fold protein n=1 Tax=Acidovorax sp. TaxID=1872122 RepID=UPI002ACEEE03|nr:DHCW motif cupin fold protein [Acidovorax sp.]MDZ7861795.1 DHCW motif cupin fold protein [Acidovorax sp.]